MAGVERTVLIVARPGPVRDGLQALLGSIPQVESIRLAHDLASARQAMLEAPPALAAFDSVLPEGKATAVLEAIKAEWPEVICIALVDEAGQEQAAHAAGADAVFRQGLPPARLLALVTSVLSANQ